MFFKNSQSRLDFFLARGVLAFCLLGVTAHVYGVDSANNDDSYCAMLERMLIGKYASPESAGIPEELKSDPAFSKKVENAIKKQLHFAMNLEREDFLSELKSSTVLDGELQWEDPNAIRVSCAIRAFLCNLENGKIDDNGLVIDPGTTSTLFDRILFLELFIHKDLLAPQLNILEPELRVYLEKYLEMAYVVSVSSKQDVRFIQDVLSTVLSLLMELRPTETSNYVYNYMQTKAVDSQMLPANLAMLIVYRIYECNMESGLRLYKVIFSHYSNQLRSVIFSARSMSGDGANEGVTNLVLEFVDDVNAIVGGSGHDSE
jgi:hypothetical protein